MDAETAVELIQQKYLQLSNVEINETLLTFQTAKLVSEILSYCNREDFPPPLVFAVVDALIKNSVAQVDTSSINSTLPLSEIKMDDTQFKFAVNNINVTDDLLFGSLKAQLTPYRLLKRW